MTSLLKKRSMAEPALWAWFLLTATFALHAADRQAPVKVMSFNIHYGAANDGENSWKHRDYLVLETVQNARPDLIGYQEVLKFQAEFLQKNLKGYGFHGVGRDDGQEKGEYVPLMWRQERFELLDSGHFWLSETPEIPGSVSWDSSLTRMLSWGIAQRNITQRKGVHLCQHPLRSSRNSGQTRVCQIDSEEGEHDHGPIPCHSHRRLQHNRGRRSLCRTLQENPTARNSPNRCLSSDSSRTHG